MLVCTIARRSLAVSRNSAIPLLEHGVVRKITLVAAVIVIGHALVLLLGFGQPNGWLIDERGKPRAIEFVGVRAAGELALQGRPAAAYDWAAHRAQHDLVVGQSTGIYFPWGYPPNFLLIAVALASLPYLISTLLWIGMTLAGYAWVTARITGIRASGLWAAATPAAFVNVSVAHTGFLMAALWGGGLLALQKQPLLAGVAFGLMSFKPQLGLLMPVALAAGRYWRAMAAAMVTIAVSCAMSIVIFGVAPWIDLLPQLGRVATVIRTGNIDMNMLVTLYGMARTLGMDDQQALTVQVLAALFLACFVWRLWRSAASFELKAAGLISASLLATPYLFVYDLTLLTILAAFLWRDAGAAGFAKFEWAILGAATVSLMLLASVPLPVGFAANALFGVVTLSRAMPFLALPAPGRTRVGAIQARFHATFR